MKCRAMQALYLLALDPVAETTADPNSYGFRSQRSTADAIEQCFNVLGKRASPQWILEGDIKGCFDAISHEWLLTHIPLEKAILKKWLKAGYMEQHILHPTEAGTPQGGTISPVLANMTLDGLERAVSEIARPTTRKGRNAKLHLIRYADDFLITSSSKELLEQEVKPVVEAFLRERGLTLSQEKTLITHIDDGFDFLGQNVRKYQTGKQHKLLIKPSKKNVHAFLEKVRAIVKANKALPAGKLIAKLNPIIRGWANYHRHGVSKKAFSSVDEEIYQTIRRWVNRRHPRKSDTWKAKKYFTSMRGNNWVFSGTVDEHPWYLTQADSVPITRHVKIQGEANPYDPMWESYFEKRLDAHMAATLKGKRWLLSLWKEQNGFCPVCHQKITKLTGWHSHRILRRSKGGSDTAANRVLLHPTCHRQVHSQGISVSKPRPLEHRRR